MPAPQQIPTTRDIVTAVLLVVVLAGTIFLVTKSGPETPPQSVSSQ